MPLSDDDKKFIAKANDGSAESSFAILVGIALQEVSRTPSGKVLADTVLTRVANSVPPPSHPMSPEQREQLAQLQKLMQVTHIYSENPEMFHWAGEA